jgi:hypothetical protein
MLNANIMRAQQRAPYPSKYEIIQETFVDEVEIPCTSLLSFTSVYLIDVDKVKPTDDVDGYWLA